jgi:hypothetical protein
MAFWWLSPVGGDSAKLPTIDDIHRLMRHPLAFAYSRVVVLATIVVLTALLYRRWRPIALGFAVVAVVAWGCTEATIFLRYPGARYLIDLPFLGPAYALDDFELGGRLSNVVAALCWLFVLRPWLIGRWPDLRILPVALLLLWQKDVIHYFDSVYLEPWGVVFSLLAIETLIEKGRDGAPLACLLIGAAATVKEPFIFALPFMWLAGAPWRSSPREFVHLSAAAVAAGMPFVVYYAARHSIDLADLGADRGISFTFSVHGLENYVAEFAKQIAFAFPGVGIVPAIAALLCIPVAVWAASDRRLAIGCSVAAGCLIGAMFVFDVTSQRWAGYFRFLLYCLPFFATGVMLLGRTVKPRVALALAVLILVLQAPSAYTAIALALGPSTGRNFVEHIDSPLVFPIKSLTGEARRAGALAPHAPIMANLVDSTLRSLPGSNINYGPLGELFCSCEPARPNVLALFVRFTNMSSFLKDHPEPPDTRLGIWQKTDAQRQACLIDLKRSCGHVFTRFEAGELVGALGTQH